MKAWFFTEQSYHPAWSKVEGPLRNIQPTGAIDPQVAGGLLNRYLDEWLLADELGLNIMANEHHASLACMSSSVTLPMAILARTTKKARLLALGIPAGNRSDPVRVAEEVAYIDALSGGRFEMGLVKGAPYEPFTSNHNPVYLNDRYWEAHDLILKALSERSGPFSWEGEHYNFRNVNVIPPPIQTPHPPVWITTSGASGARTAAERGYVCSTLMNGYGAKGIFDAYRDQFRKSFGREASDDRLAYMALLVVADSMEEAERRAHAVNAFRNQMPRTLDSLKIPPGYTRVEDLLRMARPGASKRVYGEIGPDFKPIDFGSPLDVLAQSGVLFWGTPDVVYKQISDFRRGIGGFGHLLLFGQAGTLEHAETVDSLTLFAKEVYPRLLDRQLALAG